MRFAVFCKSYRNDLERCVQLVESHLRFAREDAPLFLCTPQADVALFRSRIPSGRVTFLTDEDVLRSSAKQSWKAQQLVKLLAWRTGFADAWLWVDSDSYFIRPFGRSDFVREDGSVALPVSQHLHVLDDRWSETLRYLDDPEVLVPVEVTSRSASAQRPPGRIRVWDRLRDALVRTPYEVRLDRIPRFFGRDRAALHFLPGAVWTASSLAAFDDEVLKPASIGLTELLEYAPWEGTWIGEWELFRGAPGRHLVESRMLHVRTDEAILRARSEGLREGDLARRYVGIQLASGHQDLTRLDAPAGPR